MKKIIGTNFSIVLLFCIFILNVHTIYAGTSNTIRIGLESRYINASSVHISNSSILVGFDNGQGFVSSAHIASPQGINMVVNNNFYLDTKERFKDYQSAKSRAIELSNTERNAVVVIIDNNIFGIYFGGYSSEEEAILALNTIQEAKVVVPASTKRVTAKVGNSPLLIFDSPTKHPQIIDGDGGFISLGGRTYRGVMEVGRQLGSGITPVNIINVEEYLYSVVPSEMPASWHMEALKAQAVAARSYTFSRRGSHLNLGYELCDTVFSQVYGGVSKEYTRTTEAVRATSNLKAFYNGEVIMATYFSSSGGFTENSGNVWLNDLPYLVGVKDTYEVGGMVWERTFTKQELTNITKANGINIGNVLNVSIVDTTPNNRVSNLLITGENGSHSLGGEQIRTFFASSNGGSLHSRKFSIVGGVSSNKSTDTNVSILYSYGTAQRPISSSFVLNSNGEIVHINDTDIIIEGSNNTNVIQDSINSTGSSVTFSGRGWGHGVGMSQFGARGMAEAGYGFRDILAHYYTGIDIR